MVSLNAKQIFAGKSSSREQAWDILIRDAIQLAMHDIKSLKYRTALIEQDPYKLMDSKSMVGCYLMVFVKADLAPKVRGLFNLKVKTGMGGNAGNKGAVVCRMQIDKTSFMFINCHL